MNGSSLYSAAEIGAVEAATGLICSGFLALDFGSVPVFLKAEHSYPERVAKVRALNFERGHVSEPAPEVVYTKTGRMPVAPAAPAPAASAEVPAKRKRGRPRKNPV